MTEEVIALCAVHPQAEGLPVNFTLIRCFSCEKVGGIGSEISFDGFVYSGCGGDSEDMRTSADGFH
jgi:hypothetical protein